MTSLRRVGRWGASDEQFRQCRLLADTYTILRMQPVLRMPSPQSSRASFNALSPSICRLSYFILPLSPVRLRAAVLPRAKPRTSSIVVRTLDGVLAHVRKADALPAPEVPMLSAKDGEGNAEREGVFGDGLVGVGRYAEGRV